MPVRRHRVHRYTARCSWEGATASGYFAYDRTHHGSAPPSRAELTLSSDPAFRGNPELLNPEQLLVLAAASCQLLSFLAVAARAGVEVLAYEDEAEALMPEDNAPVRITEIRLRPRIRVGVGSDIEQVRGLVQQAHHECYIANSLQSEVVVEPTVEIAPKN